MLKLKDKHPLPKTLLRWRKYRKQQNTYFEPYLGFLDQNNRMHPGYGMLLATGRTNSYNPNIQQISRDKLVREVIAAPPGKKLIVADHSQQELRILAEVSGEKHMLKAFSQGEDLHMLMAMKMTGKPKELVTKEERSRAKIPNFLFGYGGEEDAYMMNALVKFGLTLERPQAEQDRRSYFEMWSDLPEWYKRVYLELNATGKVVTIFGRERHLPEIWSDNEKVRKAALRKGINDLVQSPANDITLLGAVLTWRAGLPLVGYIHDSIIVEVDEKDAERAAVMVKAIMESDTKIYAEKEFGVKIEVPFVAETAICDFWEGIDDPD